MATEKQEEILDEEESTEEVIEIPETDEDHVKASFRVLSRHLVKEAERLHDLDQTKAENSVKSDILQLDNEMPQVIDEKGLDGLNEKQLRLARTAMPLYVKRWKGAVGTNRGIFRSDWVEAAQATAKHLEENVQPLLEESATQGELVEK